MVEETSQFIKDFIKSCNEHSDIRYFLKYDVQSSKELHDLPFLPERVKNENIEKLLANLHYKRICYTYKKFKTSIKSWISIDKNE